MGDLNREYEPPAIAPAEGTIDLGKERELRALRAQVASLKEQLAANDVIRQSQITTVEQHEGEHGYRCGFHPKVFVSMTAKSVTCQACGAELEPIDVLREFAKTERRFTESLAHLREERTALLKETAELRKQRSSLRSQIKRKLKTESPMSHTRTTP